MKRLILFILTILLSFSLFSCNDNQSEVEGDYNVTSLKELFGRDIPQAAIFVKNGVNEDDLAYVISEIKKDIKKMYENPKTYAKEAVTKHKIFETWGEDLTASLIPNSGIQLELNKEDVNQTLSLLGIASFSDENYVTVKEATTTSVSNQFKLIVPSGLPFLAVSSLLGVTNVEVNNVTGTQIPAELTKGEADVVIAPINAGCKLINGGKANYKLYSPITFNNAFIVGNKESKKIEKAADLDGLTIHAFNEAGIPSSVLKYLFTANELDMSKVDFEQESSAAIYGAYHTSELKDEYILISEPELSKLLNEKTK